MLVIYFQNKLKDHIVPVGKRPYYLLGNELFTCLPERLVGNRNVTILFSPEKGEMRNRSEREQNGLKKTIFILHISVF